MLDNNNNNNNKDEEIEEKVESELDKCSRERDEYLDWAKRIKAEFINYKKDEDKRFENFLKMTKVDSVLKILPILDSFEQALNFIASNDEWGKGVLKIKSQIDDLVFKDGVQKISVSIGDKFNPIFHETLGEVESEYPENTIVEVLRVGYQLDDFVIRPVQVKISKGPAVKL